MKLKHWDRAFISQVRIQNPPSSLRDFAERIESMKVFGTTAIHTLVRPSPLRRGPRIKFSLIPPARSPTRIDRGELATRRSKLPLDIAGEALVRLRRQGKHKSDFYNILGDIGQTALKGRGGPSRSQPLAAKPKLDSATAFDTKQ